MDNVLQDVISGPLPCEGKSNVEGYYDGPYYEWYRFNKVGVTITESLHDSKKIKQTIIIKVCSFLFTRKKSFTDSSSAQYLFSTSSPHPLCYQKPAERSAKQNCTGASCCQSLCVDLL